MNHILVMKNSPSESHLVMKYFMYKKFRKSLTNRGRFEPTTFRSRETNTNGLGHGNENLVSGILISWVSPVYMNT